tara:strand:- start:1355 stop:3319 length:1965 start_codon:yes stop_codon:yes gene_type:complete
MAATIDWATRVISIDRASMTLVQSSPTEIRELNLNEFRLNLKDLEDDVEGMVFPTTHTHNTEVLLGGIVYARVVEMINDYTITFENGFYAVNLVGANSNVGDVVNLNNVSIRSANAAGLISNSAIEFSSFNNRVLIDIDNISGIAKSGTAFPTGTRQAPVNNIADLKLILAVRGLSEIEIIGDLDLGIGDNFSRFVFKGESSSKTTINIAPEANVFNCEFITATVKGVLDGNSELSECVVTDLDFVDGRLYRCDLGPEPIILGLSTIASIYSSYSTIPGLLNPTIDMNGTGILSLRDYYGGIGLKNYSGNGQHSIDLSSGEVTLDPLTITSGTFVCRGIGKLTDLSTGNRILTGTWNGGVTIYNEMINLSTIAEASVYNKAIYISSNGSPGTSDPKGVERDPVNNLADAITLSLIRGTNKLIFMTDFVFQATDTIVGYEVSGNGDPYTKITFTPGCVTAFCEFRDLTLVGTFIGITSIEDCILLDAGGGTTVPEDRTLTIKRTLFSGVLTLPALYSGTVVAIDCYSEISEAPYTTIDINGGSSSLIFRNYSGQLQINNMTSNNFIDVALTSGEIKLNTSSVTSGTVHVVGSGLVTSYPEDISIPSGTWNNGVEIFNETLSARNTTSVWNEIEKQESLAYSKKASDNAEQVNNKI